MKTLTVQNESRKEQRLGRMDQARFQCSRVHDESRSDERGKREIDDDIEDEEDLADSRQAGEAVRRGGHEEANAACG